MSDISNGLRKASYTFIFGFLATAIGYLSRVFLARYTTMEDFGFLFATITTITFFTIFTNLGLGTAQTKYIAHYLSKKNKEKVASTIYFSYIVRIILSLIFLVIALIFSKSISQYYFKANNTFGVLLMALGLILLTIFNINSRIFQGFQDIFTMSIIVVLQKILFLITCIVLIFITKIYSGNYLLSAYVLSLFITVTLITPRIIKILKKYNKPRFDKKLFKKLSVVSFAAILFQAGFMIIGNIDTIMLTYITNLRDVAIYSVVLPSTMALTFLGKSLHSVLFPMISSKWADKDLNKIKNAFSITNKYNLFVTLPITMIVISFPEFFLNFFFGSNFIQGSNALRVLTIGTFLMNISLIYSSIMSATNKIKYTSIAVLIAATTNIILNLILIPKYSYNGAAISTTISYLVLFTISLYHIKDYINIKNEFLQVIKFGLASISFLIVIILLKNISVNILLKVITLFTLASVTYLTTCLITKIITIDEIKFLTRKLFNR